jgi:hypothetical protein
METNMTYKINEIARPLLQPAEFHSASEIAVNPKIVPHEPGIYGWWFDEAVADVPRDESLSMDGRHLLYVGIAPNGARGTTGKRTLRDRLKNHCRGPIAHSTLRRTVVTLMGAQLELSVYRQPNGKFALPPDHEQRLTQWMAEHLRVAWMVYAHPWELEDALIRTGPRLPLNIMGSSDPFALELKARRAGRGDAPEAGISI